MVFWQLQDTHLAFPKGAVITVTEKKSSGWWKGWMPFCVSLYWTQVNMKGKQELFLVIMSNQLSPLQLPHQVQRRHFCSTLFQNFSCLWLTLLVTPAPPITTPPVATVLSTVSHESLSEAIKRGDSLPLLRFSLSRATRFGTRDLKTEIPIRGNSGLRIIS